MDEIIDVVNLFCDKARALRNKTAIIFHNTEITYGELDKLSDKCANYLNRIFSKDQKIVPFIMDRSIDMVALILGIMKTGRAFLPIDNSFPENRIEFICNNSKIDKLICQKNYLEKFRDALQNIELLGFILDAIVLEENNCTKKTDNHIAYVLYTSGSTGCPKGVLISKRALLNFVNAISMEIDLKEGKRILASTTISFDISLLETVVPLLLGMTVVLADEQEQKSPKLLGELIKKNNVDIIQMTPSLMNLLISYYHKDTTFFNNVSEILIGGEPLPDSLVEDLYQKVNAKLYNMYGPTEATIWCSLKQLAKGSKVTIGKPINGNEMYIMSEENTLQPYGMAGEIYIGGRQLAEGYLNNEDLTREKFVPNPFRPGEIMYKTGDLGMMLPDGEVAFLGRIDNQVKISGHRIELEEIENTLMKNSDVTQVVVTVKEKDEINKYLCAYYVSNRNISDSEFNEFLSKFLPEYMLPSVYVRLEEIPLMQNGKVDRKLLKGKNIEVPDHRESIHIPDEQNEIALKIKKIICSKIDKQIDYKNLENSSVLKNIGVNSIIMVGIIISIEAEFGFKFNDEDFYTTRFLTIQDFIDYVEQRLEKESSK